MSKVFEICRYDIDNLNSTPIHIQYVKDFKMSKDKLDILEC